MKDKKYVVTYPVVAFVSAITCFLPLFLCSVCNVAYIVCYSAGAAAIGALIARIILHETDDDNSFKTWQVTVYFAIAIGGWIGACLAGTWMWSSIWLCITVTGIILALGNRYLEDVNGDGIPDIFQDKKTVYNVDYLMENLRYMYIDDVFAGKPDHNRPLCLCNGLAMTVNEADKAGFTDVAAEGLTYINKFFN